MEEAKTNFVGEAAKHKGKYCAILCARYWYRGRIETVGDNVIVLMPAAAVEATGSATDKVTDMEDPFPENTPAIISTGAIEMLCFPDWAAAPIKQFTDQQRADFKKRRQQRPF